MIVTRYKRISYSMYAETAYIDVNIIVVDNFDRMSGLSSDTKAELSLSVLEP